MISVVTDWTLTGTISVRMVCEMQDRELEQRFEEAFRWAQREPAQFTERDWRAAREWLQDLHGLAWTSDVAGVEPPDKIESAPKVRNAHARAFLAKWRRGLEKLFPRIGARRFKRYLWWPLTMRQKTGLAHYHGRITRVTVATWPETPWLTVMGLLARFGERLRRCPACDEHRLFLKNKRQEYCSSQCSQRARSAKWYAAHRDQAIERRHADYDRKVPKGKKGRMARRERKRVT
jgi:hypothetical protein